MPVSDHTNTTQTGICLFENIFPGEQSMEGTIRPSWDNQYALIWLKKGRGQYHIDFKEYNFQPNTLIVISKNQDVSFQFEGDPQFSILTFTAEMVSPADEQVQELLSFCIREHFQGKQILTLAEKDRDYLEHLLYQLQEVLQHWKGQIKTDSAFHFLQLVLLYCAHLSEQQATEEGYAHDQIISHFTNLLEQNFRQTHKVSYYTDKLNLTYNSLARFTGQYCEKSPKEIITERIILEIKRQLSATSLSVKEIAYELGFDEPTNLVKFFRKNTGITPANFRKQGEFSPSKAEKSPLLPIG